MTDHMVIRPEGQLGIIKIDKIHHATPTGGTVNVNTSKNLETAHSVLVLLFKITKLPHCDIRLNQIHMNAWSAMKH